MKEKFDQYASKLAASRGYHEEILEKDVGVDEAGPGEQVDQTLRVVGQVVQPVLHVRGLNLEK